MARSYKSAWVKGHSKGAKQMANRRVRRVCEDIADGKAYRRCFNPYDVSDWKWQIERPDLDRPDESFRLRFGKSYYDLYPEKRRQAWTTWYKLTGNRRARRGRSKK